METRLIKTCHGLVKIRLADGALVPPDVRIVELCEARAREAEKNIEAMEAKYWRLNTENALARMMNGHLQQILNWFKQSVPRSIQQRPTD